MPVEPKVAIEQIDAALKVQKDARRRSKWDDLTDLPESERAHIVMVLRDVIKRFSPPGSVYFDGAASITDQFGMNSVHTQQKLLVGIATSLRRAYDTGYLQTVQELVHADLFEDLLEMAEYYLAEGHKDAAAVIGGGMLEENLRKLCVKNGLPKDDANGKPKKASVMNDDLKKASVYDTQVHKNITALLELRNNAAHGHYNRYDKAQVERYVDGIRDFLKRFPA